MYVKKSLFVVTTAAAIFGEPIPLGEDNGAMIEFWGVVGSTNAVTMELEGSNDLLNWSTLGKSLTGGGSAPAYLAETGATVGTVIPYSHVRFKFTTASGSALVSGAMNTFRIP